MKRFALVSILLSLTSFVSAGDLTGMADLIRAYQADVQAVSNFHNVPWSEQRFTALEKLYRRWQSRLDAVDFSPLDQTGRVDFLLLQNDIAQSLSQLTHQRAQLAEMAPLLEFREAIFTLEAGRLRGASVAAAAAATQVAELAKQVRHTRERCDKDRKPQPGDPPPLTITPALALRTAGAVDELRETLKRWFDFYNGYQPDFSWWLKEPYDSAGKELDEYAKLLREELAGLKGKDEDPLVGEPVGGAQLAEAIRFEFLPYTAAELLAIGERELAWCETEMNQTAREMNGGDDWRQALAKVKANYVPPGQQAALIEQIAQEAIAFTKAKQFATVPTLCEQTWGLRMMSAETMKTIPYAAYSGQDMLIAYANAAMDQDDKLMTMRGNNRHFMRLVTLHEIIPGHHLQNFQAARHHTYRRAFATPFYVEGWALYCELRFWDLGWAHTPEDRLGMLFWRANRAARILVSLKFHLGQMTPPQMVDFLVDRVGHEKLAATAEVRRLITSRAAPLYQAGYLLGGRQLDALRRDVLAAGKLTEQQFHDAVLAANAIPVELLRAELLNQPLRRDTPPAWRFADQN